MHEEGPTREHAITPHSVPRLGPNVVRRDRLFTRLNLSQWKYLLVSAPAGFGKTTLVLDWLRGCTSPVAWVSLSPLDNDPRRLFAQLAERLASIDGRFAMGVRAALEANAPAGLIANRLLDDLRRIDRPVTLILDDYHYITSPEIHHLVGGIPELAADALRLVILSRVDPPFPLARLKLSGDAIEIRERDLRFSKEETAAFFVRTLNLELTDETATALERRMEGWAAGLQMASISLQHEPDVDAFVRAFAGRNLFVLDYLMEEVVHRQSPDLQKFLLRTSILLRFDARLCRAITGMEDAARLLEQAESANLFLLRLDEPPGWYRYHHLFAELLAEQLRRFHPEEWDELHERASCWFEEVGDLASALYHGGQTSGHERVLWLMERHGSQMLDRSELGTFSRWAEGIPLSATTRSPRFLTEYIWVRLLTERFADLNTLMSLAESAIDDSATSYSEAEKADMRGTIATQRAYALRLQGYHEESVLATQRALSHAGPLSLRNQGLLYFNLGRGQSYLGNGREALEAFDAAYAFNLQARTWYHVLGVPAYVASLVAQSEGLIVARERLEAAMAFARERQLHDLPASGFQFIQLGRFLFLQNDLSGAEDCFRTARQLGESGSVHAVMSNAVAGLARVHAARRAFGEAHEMLRDLEMLGHKAYPLLYESSLEIERALLALEEGDDAYLDVWCAGEMDGQEKPFTTEREAAMLVLMRLLLRRRLWSKSEAVITNLCELPSRRQRRLTHLLARLGRSVLLSETGQMGAAMSEMATLLREAASQQLIRPFVEYGEPVRRLISEILESPLNRPVEAFARCLLERSDAPSNQPVPVFRQSLSEPLTEREQEVLYHLSCALSYQAIADLLYISHDTVKTHVKHIYGKLDVSTRADAVARAREAGLVLSTSPSPG